MSERIETFYAEDEGRTWACVRLLLDDGTYHQTLHASVVVRPGDETAMARSLKAFTELLQRDNDLRQTALWAVN